MSLPRGLWDRHIALLQGVSDVARPMLAAKVVDLSRYSTVGASFLGVKGAMGDLVWAVYRDGPAPALDSYVQVRRGDAPLDARWYAWPLPYALTTIDALYPSGVDGVFYVSARSFGGADAILRLDASNRDTLTLGGGMTAAQYAALPYDPPAGSVITAPHWTKRSDSPVPGYAMRPLVRIALASGARRWFTWGVGANMAGGSALYRSDDDCATWTATGLTGCVWLDRICWYGRMYATDGAQVYRSNDYGATWAAVPTSTPGDGSPWLYISQATGTKVGGYNDPSGADYPLIFGVSTTGVWKTITEFRSDVHEGTSGYTAETYRRVQGPYGPAPGQRRMSFQFRVNQWWYRFDGTGSGATGYGSDADDFPNQFPGSTLTHWSWNSNAYDFSVSKPFNGGTTAIPGAAASHLSFADTYVLSGNSFGGAALDYAGAAVRFYAAENQPYDLAPDLLDLGLSAVTYTANGAVATAALGGLDDTGRGAPHTPFALGRLVGGGRVAWPDGTTHQGPRNSAYGTLHFEDAALLMVSDLGDYYTASRYGIVGVDVTR